MKTSSVIFVLALAQIVCAADPAGTVAGFIGSVQLSASRSPGWKAVRIGTRLYAGDTLRVEKESHAEIRWHNGGVLRVAELTSMVISRQENGGASPSSGTAILRGRVWSNMKKIASGKTEFGVKTPTAAAAIRGTIFRVDMAADSATDVLVYEGTVEVKPADSGTVPGKTTPDTPGRHEAEGPVEIEGPQEVSLEEWITIVAGQQIRVEKTGSFKKWQFDRKKDRQDPWVKYNLDQDAKLDKK
ncbi:MAG: FecR domain-containing protein [Chitinispirillaceae bacterium]|nr:FecR domain-containing protein [Chitinispirillaceae bacterium]